MHLWINILWKGRGSGGFGPMASAPWIAAYLGPSLPNGLNGFSLQPIQFLATADTSQISCIVSAQSKAWSDF